MGSEGRPIKVEKREEKDMPHVEVTEVVKGDPNQVYELAKDMESYPKFMEDVESVTVIERTAHSTITSWVTKLQGKTIKWKERDVFDDENRVISYCQTEGDLKKFEGKWTFEEVPEGCKVTLSVDFELGIPMLAGLVNPVATMTVRKNCQSMLQALKAQVENRRT